MKDVQEGENDLSTIPTHCSYGSVSARKSINLCGHRLFGANRGIARVRTLVFFCSKHAALQRVLVPLVQKRVAEKDGEYTIHQF